MIIDKVVEPSYVIYEYMMVYSNHNNNIRRRFINTNISIDDFDNVIKLERMLESAIRQPNIHIIDYKLIRTFEYDEDIIFKVLE